MDSTIALFVGAGSALASAAAGAAAGFFGARRISRDERASALRQEMRRVYASYLGALYQVVGELRDLPEAPESSTLTGLVSRIEGEISAWARQKGLPAARLSSDSAGCNLTRNHAPWSWPRDQ